MHHVHRAVSVGDMIKPKQELTFRVTKQELTFRVTLHAKSACNGVRMGDFTQKAVLFRVTLHAKSACSGVRMGGFIRRRLPSEFLVVAKLVKLACALCGVCPCAGRKLGRTYEVRRTGHWAYEFGQRAGAC